MRQIDSRYVDRAARIEAVWEMDDEGHYVTVVERARTLARPEKTIATVYIGSDGAAARDAYLHPFAKYSVPSPWDTEPVVTADEAEFGVKVEA